MDFYPIHEFLPQERDPEKLEMEEYAQTMVEKFEQASEQMDDRAEITCPHCVWGDSFKDDRWFMKQIDLNKFYTHDFRDSSKNTIYFVCHRHFKDKTKLMVKENRVASAKKLADGQRKVWSPFTIDAVFIDPIKPHKIHEV